jgi:uncharacterized protein
LLFVDEFTWDNKKLSKVKEQHKVEFDKLEGIFDDPFSVDFIDEEHSTEFEIRYAIIGRTAEYGLVYLVYEAISEDELRFITARKAENWMISLYQKAIQDIDLETPAEAKALGLRRISREQRPKVPKGMTLRDCQVISEIKIDADLYNYLKDESAKKDSTIEIILNEILREKFEKEEARKLSEIKELRTKLLNDNEFLHELKEKLAA